MDYLTLRARVATLYQSGMTGEQIGEQLGIKRQRIPTILAAAGIEHRGYGKFTPSQQLEITRRYADGESAQSIAPDYDIAPRTVQDIARRHGVRIRGIWETRERLPLRHDVFSTLTPESLYWLGVLITDGWVTKKNTIGLSLATHDIPHLESFRSFLGYGGVISIKKPIMAPNGMGTGAGLLTVRSEQIVADLARYGIVANKSLIAEANDEAVLRSADFWRGCVDGDGSVRWHDRRTKRHASISLIGAKGLVGQFATFCKTLVPESRAVVRPAKSIYQFKLAGSGALQVISTLYRNAVIALPRKATAANEILSAHHYSHQ